MPINIMMNTHIKLLIILKFLLVSGCASRGWQLSEQIKGYDNKLQLSSKHADAQKDPDNRTPASTKSSRSSSNGKLILNGPFVKTTFGEPGLLLGTQ